jgi:hypothetical protein
MAITIPTYKNRLVKAENGVAKQSIYCLGSVHENEVFIRFLWFLDPFTKNGCLVSSITEEGDVLIN